MEAVLKHLESAAELLAVAAHSGVVEQWDKVTLSRAFHWAEYCEHLFSRFHNNPAIRRIMEEQLQRTNQSLRAVFSGYTDVSFSDLSRFQHLLIVGLLNNPDLPASIMKILFDKPGDTEQRACRDVTGFCSHMVELKSACKVLSPHTELSAVGADAEVQGVMLMERLGALLSQGSKACRAEHFLDSVLRGCEAAAEHFCLVIAAALLTKKILTAQTVSQDFLLDWLQKNNSALQHMCSVLPASLLIDLVKEHQKFGQAYCDVLRKWASEMEYNINEDDWIQTCTKRTVSFQRLTEHFVALFEASPSLRVDVEKELNALKVSDGDFDARGLSVWGDLLSALNK